MKKIRWLILAIILFSVLFASGCCLTYTGEETEDGSMFIGYSKLEHDAFVGMLSCGPEGAQITVPDEYNGIPVTTLGGYIGRGYPCPFFFSVILPEEYNSYIDRQKTFSTADPVFDEAGDGWKTVLIEVCFGKNIRTVQRVNNTVYSGICIDGEDGSEKMDILYKAVPYFTVSEENKFFYAVDGKLYDKKTGELVPGFEYE